MSRTLAIRVLAALALFGGLGAVAAPAHAAGTLTITVTTPLDGNDPATDDGVCNTAPTSPAAGRCSLRAAIETAAVQAPGVNVVINVPAATQHYQLTDDPGSLTVNKFSAGTITISGAQRSGVIVDASTYAGGATVFTIDSDAVIRNLTITGGRGFLNAGGVFLSSGNLTLSNVRITGNQGYYGGGVYQQGSGTLSIIDAQIDNNSTSNSLCSFSCGSSFGGGLDLAGGGNTILSYDDIANNSTVGFGGGMYINNVFAAQVQGSHLVITGNTANDNGGGIDAESIYGTAPQVILSNSVVENNSLPAGSFFNPEGGGIYNASFIQLTNTSVNNNKAGDFVDNLGVGGGIDNDFDATLLMTGGSISNNSAGNDAGGLNNFSIATLNQVQVTGNHAHDRQVLDVPGAGQGGGIYSSNYSTLNVQGGSISKNGAGSYGGGLAVFTHDLEIDNASITGNTAGGASSCPGFGGGLFMNGFTDTPPTLTLPHPGIHGTSISNNSALPNTGTIFCGGFAPGACDSRGGGVEVQNATLDIDGNSRVNVNSACAGGGIYLGPLGGLSFSGVISLNTATNQGGAMYLEAGSLGATISGSRILGNRATQTGGIYNLAPVTISTSVISGNIGSSTCLNVLTPCL